MKRKIKLFSFVCLAFLFMLIVFGISITSLDDSISRKLRKNTEYVLNGYLRRLTDKGAKEKLNFVDRTVLHGGVLTGVGICWFIYPEAAKILYRYVYGDGTNLELSPEYFSKSPYLKRKIKQLGNGMHGPIPLKQSQDWRLSMAFNPYYLDISSKKVRIYHPRIEFAPIHGKKVLTLIPLGKLRLKVYDNLVSALDPTPLYAFSEWKR